MEHDASVKISIFGDSCNGKTSLINRFVNGIFDDNPASTMGIDCKVKNIRIGDKRIKTFIWDTAGQEKFSAIVSVCYRNTDGIILTYDTTNYNSFLNLDKWMDKVKNIVDIDKVEIIIVGTKSDLFEERDVPYEQIIEFVNLHGTRYMETSAKDGTNIDVVFTTFVETIYNKKIKNGGPIKRHRIVVNEQSKTMDNYFYDLYTTYNPC